MISIMAEPVVMAARVIAEEFHAGQLRKYTGYPYVEHCESVASMVALATGDPEVVAAAWLHDVLEDTECTVTEIKNACGIRVADLVFEVTDVSRPADGNRFVRKALDREHLTAASPDGKTIKLADLADNTLSIASWDPDFARVYLTEKEALLPLLEGGSPWLQTLASQTLTMAQWSMMVSASLRLGVRR